MSRVNAATRFPLCAEPERLSASRPRLFGAAEFRSGAAGRRPVPAAHRGYRHRPAASRNSKPRSTKTSPGSASPGKSRCGGSREHFADYRDAIERLSALGAGLSEFREPRRDRQAGGAARGRRSPWPRDPDGAPLYPGAAKRAAAGERARLLESGAPYALRLDMAAACARAGDLGWIEQRRGSRRRDRRGRRRVRRPGATSSWRARRRRPAITSRW